MNETAWAPALVVLAAALVVGGAIALRTRGGRALPTPSRTRRDDLLRQKDAAYALIREHRATRDAQEPAAFLDELHRLEREAADVLRALDATAAESEPAPSVPASSPGIRAAQWVGAAVFFAALAFVLQTYTRERTDGGSLTGGNATTEAEVREQAALEALRAAVEANPTDIAARNRLGHALLNRQEVMEAYQQADAVVAIDPEDPEARTHQAVALVAMGDPRLAAGVLDRVLQASPVFAEALGWRGALHYQAGELTEAADVWERAITADPTLTPTLRPLVEEARDPAKAAAIRAQLAAKAASTADAPPAGTSAPAGQEAAPDPADVTGTIAGDARSLREGDILFLSARAEGVTSGPPLWVKRVTLASLPYAFRLGPGSAMIGGQPTPARVVITARVDRDRDPTTRGPDDLEARSEPIAPGTTGITLTLTSP